LNKLPKVNIKTKTDGYFGSIIFGVGD